LARLRAAVSLALLAAVAACAHGGSNSSGSGSSSSAGASGAPAGGAAGAKSIGVSIQNREAQFYQDMEAGMRSEAAKNGYTLTVVDANRDNAQQQSQV
jgi:ABC-type sugar transport system substrate-binding protein